MIYKLMNKILMRLHLNFSASAKIRQFAILILHNPNATPTRIEEVH